MAWRLCGPIRSCVLTVAGLLAAFACLDAHADETASPTFTWAVPPFAPAFITDGETLNGYAADTQNWFASHLPQYQHSILEVPLARLLAEMKSGSSSLRCSTTLIPTDERREYITFAETILLHLPISVVVRASEEHLFDPYLNEEGHVNLDALLADDQMSTAVRIGWSYGRTVDRALLQNQHAPQVMRVADDTKFLRMLDLNRIDWTLYFPSEAEFYRRQNTPDLEIKALPIAGNTTLLEATIGCAKTPEGHQAIAEINAIIEHNPTMPWTEFYANWLGPNDRDWFKAARDQYINADHFETRLEYAPSNR